MAAPACRLSLRRARARRRQCVGGPDQGPITIAANAAEPPRLGARVILLNRHSLRIKDQALRLGFPNDSSVESEGACLAE
jgi:hypothetical protein